MATDFAKLFEGINLAVTEVQAKESEVQSLKNRLAIVGKQYLDLKAQYELALSQLNTAKDGPSAEERAKGMAEAMLAVGMNEQVVRAAILAQFGAKKVSTTSSTTTANAGKLLTSGLPPQEAQDLILAAIKAAGPQGIRAETLREKFQDKDWFDQKGIALATTVKNAIIKNLVRWEGETRGRTYFANVAVESSPVESPADAENPPENLQ